MSALACAHVCALMYSLVAAVAAGKGVLQLNGSRKLGQGQRKLLAKRRQKAELLAQQQVQTEPVLL